MTTDSAISKLIAIAKSGRTVHSAGADDRGRETAGGEVSLRCDEGVFVVETVDWHESNGFRDRESLTRWTRTERGVFELLEADRPLLKSLLRAGDTFRTATTPAASTGTAPRSVPAGPESVEAILDRLEGGSEWLLLAVTPMSHEEALVYRPPLGWRHLETDCARDVELESVVRSLKPPPGDANMGDRDRCAVLIQAALRTRPAATAGPLPAGIVAHLSSIELRYGSARQQLAAGAWWLEDGRASGLVRGRAVTVEHDDAGIAEVISRDAPLLDESLLMALVRGTAVAFADRPAQLQLLEEWLDTAALAARVGADEIVVESHPDGWTSHERRRADPGDLAAWLASRGKRQEVLRPTAVQELPAALGAASVWSARRLADQADEARRALERQRSLLVDEALALAAIRPLTEAREEGAVRHEHELRRRADGLFELVHRMTQMREGSPFATDERRLIDGESGMRGGLDGPNGEWLERALAAARAEPQ